MKRSIEQRLVEARPASSPNRMDFVERTMRAIATQQTHETFQQLIRTTNITKKEHILMRFDHLPKAAIIALIIFATLSGGTAVYAAYKWLAPEVTIVNEKQRNDDQKRQYAVDIKNCGKIVGGTPIGNGKQLFEVAKNSSLNKAQVTKVLKDTCTYQGLFQFSQQQWPSPNYMKVKTGQNIVTYGSLDPGKYDTGKITAISDTYLTISTVVYSSPPPIVQLGPDGRPQSAPPPVQYFPEGKTIVSTYPLTTDTKYFYQNSIVPKSELKVGDAVVLQVGSEQIAQHDGEFDNFSSGPAKVYGVMKADFDPGYVQSAPFIGNPSLVGPIFQLVGCDGSKQYLCVSKNTLSTHGEAVYVAGSSESYIVTGQKVENGDKYFRKDIPANPSGYFHTAEGRITSINAGDRSFTLLSRGKAQKITVKLPYDVLAAYNKRHKAKIGLGDFVEVGYMKQPKENLTKINPQDIYNLSLVEYQLPNGTYTKY